MTGLYIFIVVGFLFVWLIAKNSFSTTMIRKKGRSVDARVLSCVTDNLHILGPGVESTYYSVTVQICDKNGATIVKTVQTEKPYQVGDIVHSLYIDKKDYFVLDMEKPLKKVDNSNKVLMPVVVGILLIGVIVLLMECTDNESLKGILTYILGYVAGSLFAGYGIYEIILLVRRDKHRNHFQAVMGTQVSYDKQADRPGGGYIYYPIYEYKVDGDSFLYRSRNGGNLKKYSKIGRRVHMERNPQTGEVRCREEEKSAFGLYLALAVIGLFLFGLTAFSSIKALMEICFLHRN